VDTQPTKRTCIITLGINGPQSPDHPAVVFQDYARGIARQRQQLALHGYRGDILTWEQDYPPGSPSAREAHCAFKPYCFWEAQERGYEIVLWLDSSIAIKRPIDPLLECAGRQGYLFFRVFHSVGEYCKDDALEPLGITREESFAMPSCRACVMGLDLTHAVSREFLREWKTRAGDGVTFPGPKWSGVRGWPRTASPDPRVKGHRHDQTAASVIAARLGMTAWWSRSEFSHYFDNDRRFVRELSERVTPDSHEAT